MGKCPDIISNEKPVLSLGPKERRAEPKKKEPSHWETLLQNKQTDRARAQEKMGARRRMETKYLNLSLSSFLFMLCLLGQTQLEAKGLKHQVMHSMEVRIPGQIPAKNRELVSVWLGWGNGVGEQESKQIRTSTPRNHFQLFCS